MQGRREGWLLRARCDFCGIRILFAAEIGRRYAIESLSEWGGASQALQIGLPSQRIVFGKFMDPCEGAIQQVKFAVQSGVARFREDCDQAIDHGPEAPCDLEIFRAVKSDFTSRKLYEVVPVRGWKNEPQSPFCIKQLIVVQVPGSNEPQKAMELVDGEHGGGGVVYRA